MCERRSPDFEILRRQVIDEHGPGTVLRDFETLLEFVGPEGVRATGQYYLLPMDRLSELDERLSQPLRPRLQRPQQRCFPAIQALYVLLRATELGIPEGRGKKTGKLKLNAPVWESWKRLNPTERYFTLLETWLRIASWETVGWRGGGWGAGLLRDAREVWWVVPEEGLRFVSGRPLPYTFSDIQRLCSVAFLELFGWLVIERRESSAGEGPRIAAVHRTPFGEALMPLIVEEFQQERLGEAEERPPFAAWQPRLQTYFPQWQNTLELDEPEFREGVFCFKVSLGKVWRKIAVPAEADLEELACGIIRAFKFDGDHLYQFEVRDRDGSRFTVSCPDSEGVTYHTDEFSVGYLPLAERDSMMFQYDFGANWRFDVKLEKVGPPNSRFKKAKVVESQGKPPREYDHDGW